MESSLLHTLSSFSLKLFQHDFLMSVGPDGRESLRNDIQAANPREVVTADL